MWNYRTLPRASEPIRLEDLYEHLYGLRDAGKLSDDVNLIIWAHVEPDDSPEKAAACIHRRFRD